MKITEKVSFNIASEASYVYIFSGQKFVKNAKDGPIWRVFQNLKFAVKQSYQTRSKIDGNAKMPKFKCENLGDFQTLCHRVTFIKNVVLTSTKTLTS